MSFLGAWLDGLRRRRRRKLYWPALALAREGRPPEAVAAALAPQTPEDAELVEAVVLDALRRETGAPAKILSQAAERLGLVKRSLSKLSSPEPGERVRAIAALGVLRAASAVPYLLIELKREPAALKLDVLAALAAIGDASTLPEFARVADELPEETLPGVASLMLEFGQAAYPALLPVINKHPSAFPPETLAELLRLAADRAKR